LAHQELLLKAHQAEEQRLKDAANLAAIKEKMEQARTFGSEEVTIGVPLGMTVAEGQAASDGEDEAVAQPKKPQPRKTTAQRNKASRLLAEKRALAEKAAKKRMLATVGAVKMLRRSTEHAVVAREEARAQRELQRQDKLKQGLAGQKLGKYKVPKGDIDVQLGEELSESLRGLKPEGNLFRDRFQSLQQRALVEPRVPVLPKKRTTKYKIYEKHARKRFE
jgi:nucleolar protein 53